MEFTFTITLVIVLVLGVPAFVFRVPIAHALGMGQKQLDSSIEETKQAYKDGLHEEESK